MNGNKRSGFGLFQHPTQKKARIDNGPPQREFYPQHMTSQFPGQLFQNNPNSNLQYFQIPYFEMPSTSTKNPRGFQSPQPQPSFEAEIKPPTKPLRLLTGTVAKILTLWSRVTRKEQVLFEVVGKIDYVRTDPGRQILKRFYMTDGGTGPQLLVSFFEIDRKLLHLEPGSCVKATGTMQGRNLQAFLVEKITAEELAALQRVIVICDRAVGDMHRL